MFVHGRECNRRNSMLVLYIFYKNVMYITCMYIFGFWSLFSGQVLYEAIMYQNYNITLTSLPIMFYCLFDFEYLKTAPNGDKDKKGLYLLEHPRLFKQSLDGEYFTLFKFLQYLLYSLFHAAVIYMLCYQLVAEPNMMADGKGLGIWIPGHIVFGSCIIVCNLVLLMRFNNFTGWGESLVYLMILNYFTLMFLESLLGALVIPDLYYIFDTMFTYNLVWVQLITSASFAVMLEFAAFHFLKLRDNREVEYRAEAKQAREELDNDQVEKNQLQRKISLKKK